MDLFDLTRSCFRRWYVFIPLLLITTWFSHSVYASAKPVYYSNALMGLAPPSTRIDQVTPGAGVPRNGLLDIGGATLIANMTAVGLRQPSVVDRVVAAGGAPDYSAKLFPMPPNTPQIPLVLIEETSADPQTAIKTLELVIANAQGLLQDLQQQANVPDNQMVTPFVVSPPTAPAGGMPSRMRSTLAIFLAGFGLSIVATVVFDALLTGLKRRTKMKRKPAAEAAAEAADAEAAAEVEAEATISRPPDLLEPDEAATAKSAADAQ